MKHSHPVKDIIGKWEGYAGVDVWQEEGEDMTESFGRETVDMGKASVAKGFGVSNGLFSELRYFTKLKEQNIENT
jgi:hypothetical protein